MAAFFSAETLVLASFSATGSVEAPTAVEVFLPALPREGCLDLDTTEASVAPTGSAISPRFLGLFFLCSFVRRSRAGGTFALPVRSAMAAGTTTAADNLSFFDDLVAADEGEATVAALTEVVSPATAGPFATAAA